LKHIAGGLSTLPTLKSDSRASPGKLAKGKAGRDREERGGRRNELVASSGTVSVGCIDKVPSMLEGDDEPHAQ
jgi:hypothetical protein